MIESREISLGGGSDKDNLNRNNFNGSLNYIGENLVNYLVNNKSNNINYSLSDNISSTNNSLVNGTSCANSGKSGPGQSLFVFIFVTVGVFGNILAIITLIKNQNYGNGTRQTKLDFFLRNLLANNFIALFGMLVQFILIKSLSESIQQEHMQSFCILRVVWRYFGLSSGCCAFLMATDRWLSLAKPFFYQKRVTMKLLKRTLYGLWIIAAFVTFSPIFGFGVYYNGDTNACVRYRDATDTFDLIYAYVFFAFGVFVCFGIVFCNIFVTRVLCIASNFGGRSERLMRYSENGKQMSTTERKFIKLIIVLSISFVICWMPQMISIVLAQFEDNWKFSKKFFFVADILMSVHFGSDPYIYVLLRPKHRTFLTNILKQSSSKIQKSQDMQLL